MKTTPKLLDSPPSETWEDWLAEIDQRMKSKGYRHYHGHIKKESFCYCKTFCGYMIAVLVYDFRELFYSRIGIQYECLLGDNDGRIDLSVSKDITLEQFEAMADTFYQAMKQ